MKNEKLKLAPLWASSCLIRSNIKLATGTQASTMIYHVHKKRELDSLESDFTDP